MKFKCQGISSILWVSLLHNLEDGCAPNAENRSGLEDGRQGRGQLPLSLACTEHVSLYIKWKNQTHHNTINQLLRYNWVVSVQKK